jgi:hypothetical protein
VGQITFTVHTVYCTWGVQIIPFPITGVGIGKLTPASAFRHPSSQSRTRPENTRRDTVYRYHSGSDTVSIFHSGTRLTECWKGWHSGI